MAHGIQVWDASGNQVLDSSQYGFLVADMQTVLVQNNYVFSYPDLNDFSQLAALEVASTTADVLSVYEGLGIFANGTITRAGGKHTFSIDTSQGYPEITLTKHADQTGGAMYVLFYR